MADRARQALQLLRSRVEGDGGVLLEVEWLGSRAAHRMRCPRGHDGTVVPSSWNTKRLGCRPCSLARVSERAWEEFHQRVADQGGAVLESKWLGNKAAHLVRCSQGHENRTHPQSIQQGQGICRTCAGVDSQAAWRRFQQRIAAMGGVVVEPKWLGNTALHRVTCAAGHESRTRPSQVHQGSGICKPCAGRDPAVSWAAFQARVAELGGRVLEPRWLGSKVPHRVLCVEGHVGNPRPDGVKSGRGICRACAGLDPVEAERAFRRRVTELGGVVLEPKWRGSDKPHRARCRSGHDCTPRPASLNAGTGMCRFCALKREWDVFYIVISEEDEWVKFGITSGDPRPRLRTHKRDGFTRTLRLLENFPDALPLEQSVLATLTLCRESPVRGREYFALRSLATILDVVDHYRPQVALPSDKEQLGLF